MAAQWPKISGCFPTVALLVGVLYPELTVGVTLVDLIYGMLASTIKQDGRSILSSELTLCLPEMIGFAASYTEYHWVVYIISLTSHW